jgi:hypothetical protein
MLKDWFRIRHSEISVATVIQLIDLPQKIVPVAQLRSKSCATRAKKRVSFLIPLKCNTILLRYSTNDNQHHW